MSQLQNDIFKSLEEDSEIYDVLLFVARLLRILFYLAYHSPLLGVHLKRFVTMSSPPASQQHIPDTDLGSTHDSYRKLRSKTQIRTGLVQSTGCESGEIPKGKM